MPLVGLLIPEDDLPAEVALPLGRKIERGQQVGLLALTGPAAWPARVTPAIPEVSIFEVGEGRGYAATYRLVPGENVNGGAWMAWGGERLQPGRGDHQESPDPVYAGDLPG